MAGFFHLFALQGCFNLFAAGPDLAKYTGVIDCRSAGDGLSDQTLAEIVNDASDWKVLM